MRELLHKFGYLSADGDGDRYISSGGMVSDELGRLAQAYSVSEVELGELGAGVLFFAYGALPSYHPCSSSLTVDGSSSI